MAYWLAIIGIGLMAAASAGWAEDLAAGLADPTRPSYSGDFTAGAQTRQAGPVLQSTFVSVSQRRAVIGGKTYIVGDQFGSAVITEIQPYEVVLKRGGRETRLRLLPKLAKEAAVVNVPANSQEGGQK